MAKLIPGTNDLATTHPDLAKQADGWDPRTTTAGSAKDRDWMCKKGHQYQASCNNRTRPKSLGCPYCSGKRPVAGSTDLATLEPEIAGQADGWDPTTVTQHSGRKVGWRCSVGHTWNAVIASRTGPQRSGCPICGGKRALSGYNDLATLHPDIAAQADGWDPSTVTCGSGKKRLWVCDVGHRWEAIVHTRTPPMSCGCPYCAGKIALPGENDLATTHPDIAAQADGWDPITVMAGSDKVRQWRCKAGHTWKAKIDDRTPPKNIGCPYCGGWKALPGFNDLRTLYPAVADQADGWDPTSVTPGSSLRRKWICKKGHSWSALVKTRTPPTSGGCPVCSGKKVLAGFNDLGTTCPEVAAEAEGWDPSTLTTNSNKKMSWRCPEGHIYPATVANRTPPQSQGCPYCAGKKALPGFNDLATICPEIAAQADGWDPTTVTVGSGTKKPWRCSEGHTWEATINSRNRNGCPYCGGKRPIVGSTDLATLEPELAAQADGWDPTTVTQHSGKRVGWRCSLGHTWNAVIASRTGPQASGCPYCAGRKVLVGFNDLATLYPEVAIQADGWDPGTVTAGSDHVRSWRCADGHRWKTNVFNRTPPHSKGCPSCTEFGYDPNSRAWIYLMERLGEQQLGITNDLKTRIRRHEKRGWDLLQVEGPHPGDVVASLERDLKKWLKKEVGTIDGTTESWSLARLQVSSLLELCNRSGVKTNLIKP